MPKLHRQFRSRHGKKDAKGGLCSRYRAAKVVYHKRAVAEFDRQVMQAKHPEFVFNAFRCDACSRWHVGRKMNDGQYVLAEDQPPSE